MAENLFDFINGMTSRPEEFKKIKMHERGKHFFMVNRLCSISFPIQASYFNHIKIHPGQAVSFWQDLLSKKYTRTPGWMYVKTKKEREQRKAMQPISDDTLKKYAAAYKVSQRDIADAMEILGESMYNELKNFETLSNQ